MTTTQLKHKLHLAIDTIQDESLLEAAYSILHNGHPEYILPVSQKKELRKRLEAHDKGLTPSIPWKKSLKAIRSKVGK
jgi:hypothetical protein